MVATTETKSRTHTKAEASIPTLSVNDRVDEVVHRRLEACSYRYVFEKVAWQYDDGRLTLRGSVPSFYLKQVLQELLRNIEQIDCLANEVDVVSSTGLSSERGNANVAGETSSTGPVHQTSPRLI